MLDGDERRSERRMRAVLPFVLFSYREGGGKPKEAAEYRTEAEAFAALRREVFGDRSVSPQEARYVYRVAFVRDAREFDRLYDKSMSRAEYYALACKQTRAAVGARNMVCTPAAVKKRLQEERGGRARATRVHDRPLGTLPLKSYRYRGSYGWIMIGAVDNADALREAERSLSSGAEALPERLEVWDGKRYVAARGLMEGAARTTHGSRPVSQGFVVVDTKTGEILSSLFKRRELARAEISRLVDSRGRVSHEAGDVEYRGGRWYRPLGVHQVMLYPGEVYSRETYKP
jgi:hypothetical protein